MFEAYWRRYCNKGHVQFPWTRFSTCLFTVIQRLVEEVEAANLGISLTNLLWQICEPPKSPAKLQCFLPKRPQY